MDEKRNPEPVIYFCDLMGFRCSREVATVAEIVEFDNEGRPVRRTYVEFSQRQRVADSDDRR